MSLDQLIAKLDQTPELGSRDLYKVLITIRYFLKIQLFTPASRRLKLLMSDL